MKQLLTLAKQVMARAYAPYSKFKVGAAIETTHHKTYVGCNVENVSYGLTQCAEASAIGCMVSDGERHIKRILIISSNENFTPPCGACRQRIAEFADADTEICLVNGAGEIRTYSMSTLLPFTFDETFLENNNDSSGS